MVRTIDSTLLGALNATTRRTALTLTIEDHVIHYAPYQAGSSGSDAWNDGCIANDNSIMRVQLTRSGFASNFQVQRITDPSQASQWTTWTTLTGSTNLMFQDGGCAISNSAGTLRAFAQRGTGGNTLWVWTSTNNGVSWSGPVSVLTPPGGALLKGITSAGNNDVFFLYDVLGGDAVGCSFFASGSWSTLNTWTFAPLAYGAGLAATWNAISYTIIYSDGYSLASCTFNPTGSVWSNGVTIAATTSDAIGRIAPHLSFADGLYTLTCTESDSGSLTGTLYSYPRLRQSADLLHWSQGLIVHDMTCTYSALTIKLPTPNSGTAGARYYLASIPAIYSAPIFQNSNATQYLDASNAILSYQRHEQLSHPSRLEIVLDNAHGTYNALVTTSSSYQPIGLNAALVLSEGYKTSSPHTVKVGIFHLEQIRFVRSPQENQLVLIGRDLSRNLDLLARYQNVYTNQTLGYLVTEMCALAGLFSIVLPTTTQISQNISSFILPAGQSYRHALDELCSTYGLSYFLDQNETLQFRELASSDPSVWSYQPEIETVSFGNNDQRANHIIVTGKVPTSGGTGSLTNAEVFDDAHIHLLGLERLLYHVDPKLTSATQCNQKATFLLAQEVRSQIAHTVTVPLNPALQLLDAITLTDSSAPVGSGQNVTCRITQVQARFDAQQALNELQLMLEGL